MGEIFDLDTSRLLNETISYKLKHNNMLRSLANDNDIIWQQMSFKYFIQLINSGQLYFKSLANYDDYDERRWSYYEDTIYKKSFDQLKSYEKRSYISCWYNDRSLSDVVFKQYAASDDGIAVGTTVKALRDYFSKNLLTNSDKFYFGNVQYIKATESKEAFDHTQLIAPAFIKGEQFRADKEYRVLWQKEAEVTKKEAAFPGSLLFPPNLKTDSDKVKIPSFVKWIAIKSISGYAGLTRLSASVKRGAIKTVLKNHFAYPYLVRSENDPVSSVDGFVVLQRNYT